MHPRRGRDSQKLERSGIEKKKVTKGEKGNDGEQTAYTSTFRVNLVRKI